MNRSRAIGDHWEREAESFLQARGLKTVTRNFRCRMGEIDLIMRDRECLVFAEVRFRKNKNFGSGAESVTRAKQRRIIRAARHYLQQRGHCALQACRFDVLSLSESGGRLIVCWIQDAFISS